MRTVRRHDRGWVGAGGILAVAATLWASMAVAVPGVAVAAPGDRSPLVEIRATPAADLGLSDVAGVTFNPRSGGLVVADAAVERVLGVDRAGRGVPETALAGVNAATLSVDPRGDRLTGVAPGLLVAAQTGGRGPAASAPLTVSLSGVVAAEFDQVDGDWVGLVEGGAALVVVDGAPDRGGAKATRVELSGVGSAPLVAVAPNPNDGLIYVLGDALYAVDESGAVQRSVSLSDAGLSAPRDMVFGASSDQTDAAGTLSLFVVDGADSAAGTSLVELSLDAAAATLANLQASLVDTVDLSQLNPPAPDSSGIVYLPAQDRLMVSDSEVEEMSIYAGVNLYKVTRAGSLTDTGTTVSFSEEPTGLGFQSSTNTLLVSDDDEDRIFKVVPGNDGRHGTGDDSITSIPTSFTGNNDAEDVTFHPDSGHVFVIDGVNREVYRYQLGGAFVSQFDVGVYGAGDPEGIAFDAATGTFFVLDDASTNIYQVDINGGLVNTIGIGALGAIKAAGIAVAPASNGSGNRNLYIVDRGVDNDGNPNENDGAIYEVSIPGSGPVNQAPVVNAGADQTVTLPATVSLSGTATDDGRPAPPATLTTTWSQLSGPGTVTFANPSALSTTASFSAGGVYVVRLTASDSVASSVDDVTITVVDPNAPSQLEVAIAASTDDAEETNAGGNVNRSSADLEMVADGSNIQTVGLRFVGVNLPDNAVISNAYVQFTVDEVTTAAAALTVRGEKSNNAVTYSSPAFNVTSRPDTTASVAWSPPAWSVAGVAGVNQRTPNLAPVVQEIIDQPGWLTGNAVALTIAGTGVRTARSFDFGSGAPLLHIDYTIGGSTTNQAPVVNAGTDQTVTLPNTASLSGTATDDGLPNPPATITTTWSKVSGPGTITFANPSALSTTASFTTAGVYVLRLTATDSVLSASDDIQITVGAAPPTNQAPTVNAGTDQTITLPSNVALVGSTSDDGLPNPPATVTVTWSQVSGPGTTTFTNPSARSTSASFTAAGVYLLRLTATDSALTATDDIQITVNPAPVNQAPTVNAGIDQTVTLPNNAALVGTASDDGLPEPPATVTVAWSQVSGPATATATFGNASSLSTTASFTTAGVYVLRLTASDSVLSATDDIEITVNSAPPVNQAPTVNAGVDQTVTLPNNAALVGSTSDDGLPNPPATVTVTWSQVSGPGTTTFTNPSARSTTASFTAAGVYVLRLTASDSVLTATDDIEITVNPAPVNQAPTVNAGVDQTVTLPNGASLVGTASDDGLPEPPATVTVAWSQVSGPGTTTFGNANSLSTSASFTTAGVYVLRLTASDTELTTTDDIQITVNPAPVNQAPTVNAGVDQTVTLPNSVALVGTASDDALPDPPATVTVTWSQVSGPGTTTFGNANSLSTTASFTTAGVYVLRLTASDTELTTTDDMQVTVNPAPVNQAPTVNAGVDQTVTLPSDAALVGAASDDGLPEPPATVTVTWSQVSGPGTTTFGNANSLSTSASFTTAGVYVLRLTASDTELSATDDIQITVNPAPPVNQAPTVNAGIDQTVTLPNTASLVGAASDDGLPEPPATVTVTWSQVSGPGTTTFGNANSLSTSASFTTAGVYVLRLTASDSVLSATDDIQITVNPAPVNQAPTVNAGVDQTVTLPNTASLLGTASDDGLPTPPAAVTVTWSQVSGPGTATFGNANSLSTNASFTTIGVYVLRLTASDTLLSTTDDIQITVNPPAGPRTTLSAAISAASDDAEENNAGGAVDLTSSDLQMGKDGSKVQTVGLRFASMAIPAGAVITNAYVQFTASAAKSGAASLTVRGEKSPNPTTYTTTPFNVTVRPDTTASAAWSPAAWKTAGGAGVDQRTANLWAVVQEIVGQPGWASGNAMAVTIAGTGLRTARAFSTVGPPVLHVEYVMP